MTTENLYKREIDIDGTRVGGRNDTADRYNASVPAAVATSINMQVTFVLSMHIGLQVPAHKNTQNTFYSGNKPPRAKL